MTDGVLQPRPHRYLVFAMKIGRRVPSTSKPYTTRPGGRKTVMIQSPPGILIMRCELPRQWLKEPMTATRRAWGTRDPGNRKVTETSAFISSSLASFAGSICSNPHPRPPGGVPGGRCAAGTITGRCFQQDNRRRLVASESHAVYVADTAGSIAMHLRHYLVSVLID